MFNRPFITIKQFPNLPRFGSHAGQVNRNFLNADIFQSAFLKPCEPFKSKIGVLMFEFSQFHKHDYETIPTRVGRTLNGTVANALPSDHPHAGGENSCAIFARCDCGGPSPRGWGEQVGQLFRRPVRRTIPTRVGRTLSYQTLADQKCQRTGSLEGLVFLVNPLLRNQPKPA